ncbi:DUF4307 domain-containing protein [Brachybacterium sp. AOP25-B2-12]|uniref:DUF4307 domain-containing protein n=1 Tax=Brachybacterium sp. AOP25-B2-12 TaxID=3457710 RepID=UPI0040334897
MSTVVPRPSSRYGRPPNPRRNRVLIGILAAVFLVLVVVIGIGIAHEPVRAETISYDHVDDRHIDVTYQVTMRPGTTARCTLEALDASRGQVGFTQVDIGAQRGTTTNHTTRVATQGAAVSATVSSCDPT